MLGGAAGTISIHISSATTTGLDFTEGKYDLAERKGIDLRVVVGSVMPFVL
jgi:hypothetical protein